MNILIDNSFKAIRRGTFVTPNTESGEFIFGADEDLTLATLKEIASANKVSIGKRDSKVVITNKLIKHFGDIEMAEQNEQTTSEKILAIVKTGINDGKTEDEILILIVMAGTKFGQAKRLYREAAESAGFMLSQKDRQTQIDAILKKMEFAPQSFADVQDAMNACTKEVKSTDDKQALSCIKKWAKTNEIELPKVPAGTTIARKSFVDEVFEFLIANPGATDKEINAWVAKEKAGKKSIPAYQKLTVLYMKYLRKFHEVVSKQMEESETA